MNLIKKTAPWIIALLFGFECLASGVDMTIERIGSRLRVGTTNNTEGCFWFQWNTTLATNGWHDFHGYMAGEFEKPIAKVDFDVTAMDERVFWRIRKCNEP